MQAARFERLSFDPFSLLEHGFIPAEVDVGGCDVVEALVVTLMVVVSYKGVELEDALSIAERIVL